MGGIRGGGGGVDYRAKFVNLFVGGGVQSYYSRSGWSWTTELKLCGWWTTELLFELVNLLEPVLHVLGVSPVTTSLAPHKPGCEEVSWGVRAYLKIQNIVIATFPPENNCIHGFKKMCTIYQ